nr:AAA family ATPase [Helicobacter suis]
MKQEFLNRNFYIAEALWVLALERLLVIFNPLGILGQTEVSYAPYADDYVKTREIPKLGQVGEYLLTRLSFVEKLIFERAFNQHEESLCMTALLSLLSHMDFPVAVSREYTEYRVAIRGETEYFKKEGRLVFAKNPHFKPDMPLNENAHDLGSLYALFAFGSLEKEAIIKIMEYSNSQDNIPAYAAPLITPLAPFMTLLSPLQTEESTNILLIKTPVKGLSFSQDKNSPKTIGEYSDQKIRQEDAKERIDFTEESTKPQDKYSPKAIKKYLDQHVIGQEKAKKRMGLVFSDHYKRIKEQSSMQKNNALCIGPSGSGKTFLIEKAAEYLDIPYCIFNAASLSPSGLSGADVSEIFVTLYTNASYDIEKAQRGVVVLDEIDKLGQRGDGDENLAQRVQNELLKVVERGEVCFAYNTETISLRTDNILFVGLGHFEKLWRDNAKVQQTHSIGFISDKLLPVSKSPQFSSEDLMECGMKREFLRRFSVRVIFDPVDIDMLAKLFDRRVMPYQEEFGQNGSELEFSLDAKRFLIENALKEGTGMSALDQKLHEVLANLRFNIENYKGSKCVITIETLKTGDVEVIPLD